METEREYSYGAFNMYQALSVPYILIFTIVPRGKYYPHFRNEENDREFEWFDQELTNNTSGIQTQLCPCLFVFSHYITLFPRLKEWKRSQMNLDFWELEGEYNPHL